MAVGGIKASAIDAVRYPIEAIIVHNKFSKTGPYNDIALIRLKYDIQFNKFVSPIKLPKNNSNKYENNLAVLSGWGLVVSLYCLFLHNLFAATKIYNYSILFFLQFFRAPIKALKLYNILKYE